MEAQRGYDRREVQTKCQPALPNRALQSTGAAHQVLLCKATEGGPSTVLGGCHQREDLQLTPGADLRLVAGCGSTRIASGTGERRSPPQSPTRPPEFLGGGSRLRLCPLEVDAHVHLTVHRHRAGEVLSGPLVIARALVEVAEAEVAVGNQRVHVAFGGQGQRRAIVVFGSFSV